MDVLLLGILSLKIDSMSFFLLLVEAGYSRYFLQIGLEVSDLDGNNLMIRNSSLVEKI